MNNRIEEYFSKTETNAGNELFRLDNKNSDIKSELSEEELRWVDILKLDDEFLARSGVGGVFTDYVFHFLRLKVSLQRKGRSEYVEINRRDTTDSAINKLSGMKNLMDPVKK